MRDSRGADQALSPRQAALVTLSAAIAGSDGAGVEREAERAAASGVEPAALYEAVLQSYLFVGFPRAIEAFFAARPVLERLGAAPSAPAPDEPAAWRRDGDALCRRVYGRNYDRLMETMRTLSPDLAARMIDDGYGKTLSRPGLSATDREYGVIAILTVTRMWRQLRSHALGAVHVGGSRAGVRASIWLTTPWSGAGTVEEALRVTGMEGSDARR